MKKSLIGQDGSTEATIDEKLLSLVENTQLGFPEAFYNMLTNLEEKKETTRLKAINEILKTQFDSLRLLILKIDGLKNSAAQEKLLERFSDYILNGGTHKSLKVLDGEINLEIIKESLLETEDEKAWSKVQSGLVGKSFLPEVETYIKLIKSKKDRRDQLEKEWKLVEHDVSDGDKSKFQTYLELSRKNPNDNESLEQADALLKRKKAWSDNGQRKTIIRQWEEVQNKTTEDDTSLYLNLIHNDIYKDSLKEIETHIKLMKSRNKAKEDKLEILSKRYTELSTIIDGDDEDEGDSSAIDPVDKSNYDKYMAEGNVEEVEKLLETIEQRKSDRQSMKKELGSLIMFIEDGDDRRYGFGRGETIILLHQNIRTKLRILLENIKRENIIGN